MGRPDAQLSLSDVRYLLGINTDVEDSDRVDVLIELTEVLLEKNGEEWITQNSDIILEQWNMLLRLGVRSEQ